MTDTLTAAKAAMRERGEPYWVETQFGCLHCGSSAGRFYRVIDPDDHQIGPEFDTPTDAKEFAEALNAAYEAGRTDEARIVRAASRGQDGRPMEESE